VPSTFINGIEIQYLLADFVDPWSREKEHLILLHGWMGCKENWVRQIPYFAREFVVIAPDLRGFGQSSKPPRGYGFDEYIRDIEGLLDIIGAPAAHVLGQSFGGILAQLFALAHPERTRSLVLWATRSEPVGRMDNDAVAEFIRREGMPAFAEMFSGNLADEAEPEITEWNKRLVANGRPHVAIETLREVSAVNITGRLHEIKAATLILHSREDKVIPFAFAEKMRDAIPGSVLYEYKGSHGAYLKNPEECNRVILEFLKSLSKK
jgi:pimeloyl-ACP methyl ester carboxylesterase